MTERWATWEMDAKASPRNPYVVIRDKSSNVDSFDVVNLSARIGKSSFCLGGPAFNAIPVSSTQCSMLTRIPQPLSCIWSNFKPPSLTVTRIEVEPASRLFSKSSFKADAGRCIIWVDLREYEDYFSRKDSLPRQLFDWLWISRVYGWV